MGLKLAYGEVHLWRGRRCVKSNLLTDSRRLIHSVLSNYLPEDNLNIKKTGLGKPMIDTAFGSSPIRFSLSHCHELVVMAVAKECEVGVDCEYIHRKSNLNALSEYYLSNEEKKRFNEITHPFKKRKRFYEYWTLKEAYLKALGYGLHYPLKKIDFQIESCPATQRVNPNIQINDRASQYVHNNHSEFGLYSLGDHQVAIATLNSNKRITYKIFTINEVTKYAGQEIE